MRRADMKFEWFVEFRKSGSEEIINAGGKSSTAERADKSRKAWISHMNLMNRAMEERGNSERNILVNSGVRDVVLAA